MYYKLKYIKAALKFSRMDLFKYNVLKAIR